MNQFYLKPGELFFSDHPTEVTTVLGSCVAVSMHHPDSGLGAICHAVQPRCHSASACTEPCADCFRYVECVIPRMAQRFQTHGVRLHSLQVKLFGGAAIFSGSGNGGSRISVGQMNVAAAEKTINDLNLRLSVANTGGNFGRKMIFNTQTGTVWMKEIHNNFIAPDTHPNNCSQSLEP